MNRLDSADVSQDHRSGLIIRCPTTAGSLPHWSRHQLAGPALRTWCTEYCMYCNSRGRGMPRTNCGCDLGSLDGHLLKLDDSRTALASVCSTHFKASLHLDTAHALAAAHPRLHRRRELPGLSPALPIAHCLRGTAASCCCNPRSAIASSSSPQSNPLETRVAEAAPCCTVPSRTSEPYLPSSLSLTTCQSRHHVRYRR